MESAMESEVEDSEYDVDEEGAVGLTDWEELNSNRCQEFSQSTPRRKRNKCARGECGEQPRYEAAAMVRTTFEDFEDEEGSDVEDEGQECGKGPSKKPPNQANKLSDRQKGLEKAVSEVLPENPHMHCGHHLKMNVQKHFGKVAVQVMQSLFHAPSEDI
ncbi:hypothetical protein R1sor_026145 [Riccia sorocarpa]|uniref:Uncharacterized protein n=1 Tax=Riccia sorocarpa TaxID=122646 RepID=A0ABD3GC98_9MARC